MSPAECERELKKVAGAFEALTATLHRTAADGEHLELVAALGVPDRILPVIQRIPFGKGMAGLCAERRAPVTVCNLQTDTSGVARPGAKETGVEGALVVPILDPATGQVLGTLGVGKAKPHDYSDDERGLLADCAAWLGAQFPSTT